MKYSLAIIALLGLTNAIRIVEEPVAADAVAAAEVVPAVDAGAVAKEAEKKAGEAKVTEGDA